MFEWINKQVALRGAVVLGFLSLGATGYWQYKNASNKAPLAKAKETASPEGGAKGSEEKPSGKSRLMESFGNSTATGAWAQNSANNNHGAAKRESTWGERNSASSGDGTASKTQRPFYERSNDNKT